MHKSSFKLKHDPNQNKNKYSNVFYDLKKYGLVDHDDDIDSETEDKDFVMMRLSEILGKSKNYGNGSKYEESH